MPSPRHKPLFNRRYLVALVWILPLVIVLLQLSGRSAPLAIGWNGQEELHFLTTEDSSYRLELLLPTPPALDDAGWLHQQLRAQRLRARLNEADLRTWLNRQGWHLEQVQAAGYQSLRLAMAERPSAAQRQQFLSLLESPGAQDLAPQTGQLQARRYLDLQQAQTQLLAAFGSRLPAELKTPASPRWTLSGPLSDLARQSPPRVRYPTPAPLATGGAGTGTDRRPHRYPLATAGRTAAGAAQRSGPGPAAAGGRSHRRLLPHIAPPNSDYRWRWVPLARGGYRVLLLHRWPEQTTPLGEQLAAALDQKLLDQLRNELLAQLDHLLEEEPRRWLNLVALYRLPLDSDRAFRDTLEHLTLEEARQLLTRLLPPTRRLAIRLKTTEP